MNAPTLWLTDRLPALWRLLGVNYPQMRAILAVKLTLDNRRTNGLNTNYSKEGEAKNTFWKSLGLYALFGGFMSIYLATTPREGIVAPLLLFFGYTMTVCATTLLNDYSSVVLDSSDNQIMLFRPVDGRTMLVTRIVHVVSYLLMIALSTSVVGVLVIGNRFGPVAGLLTLGLVVLSAGLMVFLTNVFYLLLMQFTSEERLRETLNYVQIGMAILFYGGYQLLPRLMKTRDLLHPTAFDWQWWHLLLPPCWCAGSLDLVINRQTGAVPWLGLALILATPLAGIWFMSRVLASSFSQKLARLDQTEHTPTARKPAVATTNVPTRQPLADRVAKWCTGTSLERAAFTMIWHLTGRDRKFKLKTYPSLGFGIVYVALMGADRLEQGAYHLFTLYFGTLYLLIATTQISISDNYKAAWIYLSAPVGKPGELLSGGLKALIVKLMLPYFSLIAAYVFYRRGVAVLPDVLLALAGSVVILLIAATLGNRNLPFSQPQDTARQNQTARMLLSMLAIGLVGFGHWGLTLVPYAVWGAIPVMLLVAALLLRAYQRTQWSQILLDL